MSCILNDQSSNNNTSNDNNNNNDDDDNNNNNSNNNNNTINNNNNNTGDKADLILIGLAVALWQKIFSLKDNVLKAILLIRLITDKNVMVGYHIYSV